MPSVAVKVYSVFFKFMLKHRLQSHIQSSLDDDNTFGVTTRPEESVAAANPSFTDGIATKDIHIDPFTSLSVRIFLPETCLAASDSDSQSQSRARNKASVTSSDSSGSFSSAHISLHRRNSYGPSTSSKPAANLAEQIRRSSYGGSNDAESLNSKQETGSYRGYSPSLDNNKRSCRKLPVMLQFHGGGFVAGSKDSSANDFFCRRIAKLCDVIVIAVGYRLAPENRYPAAFDDGVKVLHWLAKQANLAECGKSLLSKRGGGSDIQRSDINRHIVDAFGASMVEPWLAAHGDPTRCVLLGVSCGANIADYVARKAVEAGNLLDPVKVVAQVLMYPFFIGSVPTRSEIKLANSYFYDKAMCILAWKLFLSEEEFSLDHPAANPLIPGREPPLKYMPPMLTVVAEHDWMRDRAIAYSEELRKVNVDAPVLEYKDAVHEFATLDMLLRTPQAQACAEDIAIWVKKYISLRGHEFSY
ncbi:probable carboxylesterase 11 [Macadamia integrifolia]|uniref:probable carboxylesterase 11 n=1 Tax=Macadamia integrifolia TaxID=60698 RepID=UPI001C4F24EA|nr:probable carboxylesterase 11 [Macadamia integrifolia]